jgi:hypothetical protein
MKPCGVHVVPSSTRPARPRDRLALCIPSNSSFITTTMATEMAVDKPASLKLDVDEYLTSALSATPAELHPYFTAFKDLHSRKYVIP